MISPRQVNSDNYLSPRLATVSRFLIAVAMPPAYDQPAARLRGWAIWHLKGRLIRPLIQVLRDEDDNPEVRSWIAMILPTIGAADDVLPALLGKTLDVPFGFDDVEFRANASIAVSNGQLLLRTDRYLYCISNG